MSRYFELSTQIIIKMKNIIHKCLTVCIFGPLIVWYLVESHMKKTHVCRNVVKNCFQRTVFQENQKVPLCFLHQKNPVMYKLRGYKDITLRRRMKMLEPD